jgi:hypothetical protein
MPECCWTLVGAHDRDKGTFLVAAVQETSGGEARVEADWAWSLRREEEEGDVQGFFHTHLPGVGVNPSATDVRSMQAWTLALGKPLLCLIAEEEATEESSGYLFEEGSEEGKMKIVLPSMRDGKWRVDYELE